MALALNPCLARLHSPVCSVLGRQQVGLLSRLSIRQTVRRCLLCAGLLRSCTQGSDSMKSCPFKTLVGQLTFVIGRLISTPLHLAALTCCVNY